MTFPRAASVLSLIEDGVFKSRVAWETTRPPLALLDVVPGCSYRQALGVGELIVPGAAAGTQKGREGQEMHRSFNTRLRL